MLVHILTEALVVLNMKPDSIQLPTVPPTNPRDPPPGCPSPIYNFLFLQLPSPFQLSAPHVWTLVLELIDQALATEQARESNSHAAELVTPQNGRDVAAVQSEGIG